MVDAVRLEKRQKTKHSRFLILETINVRESDTFLRLEAREEETLVRGDEFI